MKEPSEQPPADDRLTTPLVAGFDDFRRIGNGSFSTVYRATQIRMGRPVAVKVLDAELATEADRRAFARECRAMGVLSRHPNIVTVYSDDVTIDGRACLVMELYDQNYRDILTARGPLPVDELLLVGVKVAGALQVAHDTGVLHRDIKPHNIFVSDFGEPALGDFGISSIDDERTATIETGLSVAYAAPEVIEDAEASFLSDVYSLAASLHHLAAGRPPFTGSELGGVIRRIVSEEPPTLERDDVPDSLRELLRRGLAKSPDERSDSAGDFAESLRDIRVEVGLDAANVPLSRSERAPDRSRAGRDRTADESDAHAAATLADGDVLDSLRAEREAPVASPTGPHDPDTTAGPSIESTIRRPGRGGAIVDDESSDESGAPVRVRRWWSSDHRSVDLVIAVVVVALVVYAVLGLT